MNSDSDSDFEVRFSKYHQCLFTLKIKAKKSRLKEIKVKLQDELDIDADCEEEKLHKLNFLTWVEYKLDNGDRAKEINKMALKEMGHNLTSLTYQAFLFWNEGSNAKADRCLDKVDSIRKEPGANSKVMEVKAELAYSYSRIGGAEYIAKAINLYESIVDAFPDEFSWKYRLGLAHRRVVHGNISPSMPQWKPASEHIKSAAKYLFDVALHCPEACLRGRAYSQLAVMKNYSELYIQNDMDKIFHEMSVQKLIDEAIEHSPNDARTLMECGRILRFLDLDKAIELLEKSIGLKKHSISLHHLGKCYESKAKFEARNQSTRNQNQPRSHSRNKATGHNDDLNDAQTIEDQYRNYTTNVPNKQDSQDIRYSTRLPSKGYERNCQNVSRNTTGGSRENVEIDSPRCTPNRNRGALNRLFQRNVPTAFTGGYGWDKTRGLPGYQCLSNAMHTHPDYQKKTHLDFSSNEFCAGNVQTSGNVRNTHNQFEDRSQKHQRHNFSRQTPARSHQSPRRGFSRNNTETFRENSNTFYNSNYTQGKLVENQNRHFSGNKPNQYHQQNNNYYWETPVAASHSKNQYDTTGRNVPRHNRNETMRAPSFGGQHSDRSHLNSPNYKHQDHRSDYSRMQTRHQGNMGNQFKKTKPIQRLISCPLKVLPLNKEDDYVAKALDCFKQSIHISWENNYPALYSLGLTLRACGQYEEATEQFNKILNNHGSGSDYFITVVCAFEQCGLCMMEMAKQEDMELSVEEKTKLFKKSEKNLLKAVSLAATLATKDPEIKNHTQNIWNSFRTLEERYAESDDSPEIIKKLIVLLQMVSQYEKIPPVIEKLRSLNDSDIADPKIVEAALKSYLTSNDYESAWTFLSVLMTTSEPAKFSPELKYLIVKTQLCTAESRLRLDVASAKHILKPLFESVIQTNLKDAHCSDDSAANDSEDDPIDVLIIWDEKSPNKANLEEKMCALQKCINDVFGIEASANLQSCRSAGVALTLQIEEMERPKLLLVMIERHSSKHFEFILNNIPCLTSQGRAPRVLVGLCDSDVIVPTSLNTYSHLSLDRALEHFSCILYPNNSQGQEHYVPFENKELSGTDLKHYVPFENKELSGTDLKEQGNKVEVSSESHNVNWTIEDIDVLNSVMLLYCSMIGQKWPL
ncbi:uncharacterized protein LOC106064374 isoform X1 [Biomphalaria glabrata]|uniref:Uncharacterized protein LOC106064374 isoform X1 n=1 Tax=Biomphalaria glabrata TaxID=6526 RepID=A0A9W3AIY9_BIOGL|nr:uncharacterized protein LOC106064374 isoform X1 [Biomphalaria glabrata]XP_055887253.1 uncharacterized protein LOC106064374 isoform X1 [Biomphalaria glabrata]XP_055887254.1 uncharacterized protein LOC106064374 isoform X1 [Biomphalaria glabrata]